MNSFTLPFFNYALRFRTGRMGRNYAFYVHVFKQTKRAYTCMYVHTIRYVRDLVAKGNGLPY